MKHMDKMSAYAKRAAGTAAATLLVACGGGGGGGALTDVGSPPVFDASAAQGRWAQGDLTAFVLPTSSGVANVWMVNGTLTQLFKYEIAGTGKLAGFNYPLSGSGVRETLSGDASLNASAIPKTLSFTNSVLSIYKLSQTDALAGASSLADVSGNWTFTVKQGAVKFDATITANPGSSSASFAASTVSEDCSYAGTLTATSVATLYDISFTNPCQGETQSYKGVVRWTSASNTLAVMGVTADGQKATFISMKRL